MITENVLQNTLNCTIYKKSGGYAPILLNIVCAVIHYLLLNFSYKIFAKYSPKRTKLHHLKKNSLGSMPPNLPSKRVTLPRAAWRFAPCKYHHLYENILNPPPRNKILDTPLLYTHYIHRPTWGPLGNFITLALKKISTPPEKFTTPPENISTLLKNLQLNLKNLNPPKIS